ncbi:MAG: hypothetical protein JXR97_05820, partial [Planctomycetes bacterium]|nr:hypothetical protein [Planctomycetota bacterium]
MPITERFFADTSFWNTPIEAGTELDPDSERWARLLSERVGQSGFNINVHNWTIPVYRAGDKTPRVNLSPKLPECYLSQGNYLATEPYLSEDHPLGIHQSARGAIPIPEEAIPDKEHDAHMSVVDDNQNMIYDMWQARREESGEWRTNAAIAYDKHGDGVFSLDEISQVHNDESIHYYGPCRASGVPAVAGLIMHHELTDRCLQHKLAFACECPAFQ